MVAVEKGKHSWSDIKHIDDLVKQFREELDEFVVNYHKLSSEKYSIVRIKGPAQARKYIEKGRQAIILTTTLHVSNSRGFRLGFGLSQSAGR